MSEQKFDKNTKEHFEMISIWEHNWCQQQKTGETLTAFIHQCTMYRPVLVYPEQWIVCEIVNIMVAFRPRPSEIGQIIQLYVLTLIESFLSGTHQSSPELLRDINMW